MECQDWDETEDEDGKGMLMTMESVKGGVRDDVKKDDARWQADGTGGEAVVKNGRSGSRRGKAW